MLDILEVAGGLGLDESALVRYGKYKAKVVSPIPSAPSRKARYILVSAMTPTRSGEGKTTTTIGLSMAFNRLGRKAVACIRQPSLGPFLGLKGGGTGGGKCRVVPEEDINTHFTGDNYAVSTAHNLVASLIDNHLYRGNPLRFDISELNWGRVLDVSDGALREVIVGITWDRKSRYFPHKSYFSISSASELMSILALYRSDADFRSRLESIVLGFSDSGRPITLKDLGGAPAVYLLMREALYPNLVQAVDGSPVFVHAGPFANISIGSSSIVADLIAMELADVVVTEAGFGVDCGGEKFVNIKSRIMGRGPDCIVIVASKKAIAEHGMDNLFRHIAIARGFGVKVVVLLNVWEGEDERELLEIEERIRTAEPDDVFLSFLFSRGPESAMGIAERLWELCSQGEVQVKFTYPTDLPLEKKVRLLAREVYGAEDVVFEPLAREKLELYQEQGYGDLPVCVAKTQYTFSHSVDVDWRRPFKFVISDAFLSAGAGFVVLISGNITTMPALPSRPRALDFQW